MLKHQYRPTKSESLGVEPRYLHFKQASRVVSVPPLVSTIIHVNWLFMLSVRVLSGQRSLLAKFWGSQKFCVKF